MDRSILILRSKKDGDATVRLQTDPVLRALKNVPGTVVKLEDPTQSVSIENGSCVLFHFDDPLAIAALERARSRKIPFSAACFGSDIYRFSRYMPSYEVTDMYLMPTEVHREVLASQFYKPVYYLPESIDPISGQRDGASTAFPAKHGNRLLWFGYADSFNKGMASLVPVLKRNQKAGRISDFTLILDPAEFDNEFALRTIPFRTETFRTDAASFDYCILSHFSLDLSLNSYIKSPNKLLTALMMGLIPIASKTPNYAAMLGEFGLQRFLFDSPGALDHILRNLDPARDSEEIARSGIVDTLAERHSDRSVAQNLLEILTAFETRDPAVDLPFKPRPLLPPTEAPPVSVTEHLRDLVPSIRRSFRWRFTKPVA